MTFGNKINGDVRIEENHATLWNFETLNLQMKTLTKLAQNKRPSLNTIYHILKRHPKPSKNIWSTSLHIHAFN